MALHYGILVYLNTNANPLGQTNPHDHGVKTRPHRIDRVEVFKTNEPIFPT